MLRYPLLVYLPNARRSISPVQRPKRQTTNFPFSLFLAQFLPFPGPPRFPRPLFRTTLHLLAGETCQVTTRHRIATLLEPLLAAEAEFIIFLLAFVRAAPIIPARFGGLFFERHIEDFCLIGGLRICTLALFSLLSVTYVQSRVASQHSGVREKALTPLQSLDLVQSLLPLLLSFL